MSLHQDWRKEHEVTGTSKSLTDKSFSFKVPEFFSLRLQLLYFTFFSPFYFWFLKTLISSSQHNVLLQSCIKHQSKDQTEQTSKKPVQTDKSSKGTRKRTANANSANTWREHKVQQDGINSVWDAEGSPEPLLVLGRSKPWGRILSTAQIYAAIR